MKIGIDMRSVASSAALFGALGLLADPGAHAAQAARAPTVVCERDSCLVAGNGALPSLVVGELVRVDPPQVAQRWWSLARNRGAWSSLPSDAREFAELVRPVTIRTMDRRTSHEEHALLLTVLMTQYEFQDLKLDPGEMVRYAPHGIDNEQAPADQPRLAAYWDLTGCVLALCTPTDVACKSAYLPGVYERHSGRAADWRTGRPTSTEPLIEPVSRRPVRRDEGAPSASH